VIETYKNVTTYFSYVRMLLCQHMRI